MYYFLSLEPRGCDGLTQIITWLAVSEVCADLLCVACPCRDG